MKFNRHKGLTMSQWVIVHQWLKRYHGKAMKCEGENCTKKSKYYNWALKSGCKYEKNRDNFIELCRSCHTRYDSTQDGRKRIGQAVAKRRLTPINVYDSRGNFIAYFGSLKESIEKLGGISQYISQVLNGRQRTTKGYIYKYAK